MMSNKLEPKADKCFFIGYPKKIKGYSFWHKLTNTIIVKKGAVFLEKEFLERTKSSESRMILEKTKEDLQHDMNDDKNIHDDDEISHGGPLISGSMSEPILLKNIEEAQTSESSVQPTHIESESSLQEVVEEVSEVQEELEE